MRGARVHWHAGKGPGSAAVRTRIDVAGDDTAFPLQSAVEYCVSMM